MRDIFLCHTGADKPWVEALATKLERETVGGRPLRVFFDKWDIDHGENILSRIEEALKTSRFLGVVMSPAFTRADWPRLEWQSRVWQDPAGRAASILPILLHESDPESGEPIEIPLPLRLLRWFDFTDRRQAEAEYQELVRRIRGEPPRRGGGAQGGGGDPVWRGGPGPRSFVGPEAPDRCDESLVSNLLAVRQHPAHVWSDLTTAQHPTDVWKALASRVRPPFVLDKGRLYCFFPPDDPANPFRAFLSGSDPREERPLDWIGDAVRERWLMWLYNDALREYTYHLGIRTPKKAGVRQTSRERQQYFCPTFDGKPRSFRWAPNVRPRTLAKMASRPDGTAFGIHYAARMRFLCLGPDAFLLLEPGWFFTEDGVTPVEGRRMGQLSTQWGGRERNATVLRNIVMWGLLLSQGRPTIEVSLGAESLVLDAVPAHAALKVGVDGDQLRLERVLRGEGAGEVHEDDGPYARSGREAGEQPDEEIDRLVALEASGALQVLDEAHAHVEAAEGWRDTAAAAEPDDAVRDTHDGTHAERPPEAGAPPGTTPDDDASAPPCSEGEPPRPTDEPDERSTRGRRSGKRAKTAKSAKGGPRADVRGGGRTSAADERDVAIELEFPF